MDSAKSFAGASVLLSDDHWCFTVFSGKLTYVLAINVNDNTEIKSQKHIASIHTIHEHEYHKVYIALTVCPCGTYSSTILEHVVEPETSLRTFRFPVELEKVGDKA